MKHFFTLTAAATLLTAMPAAAQDDRPTMPPPNRDISESENRMVVAPLGRSLQGITFTSADRADTSSCDVASFAAMGAALDSCWPLYDVHKRTVDYLNSIIPYGDRKRANLAVTDTETRALIADSDALLTQLETREYPGYDWPLSALYFTRAFLYADLGDADTAIAFIDKIEALAATSKVTEIRNDGSNLDRFRVMLRGIAGDVNAQQAQNPRQSNKK